MKSFDSLIERHAEKRIEQTAEQVARLISNSDTHMSQEYPIGRKPFGIENGDYVEAVQAKVMSNLNGLSATIVYNPEKTLEACTEPDSYSEFGARVAKTELSVVFDPVTQQ